MGRAKQQRAAGVREGLLLDRFGGRGLRALEDLQEVGALGAHAQVHVRLAAFDVVVQVVAERVQHVDRVGRRRRRRVPREQHYKRMIHSYE